MRQVLVAGVAVALVGLAGCTQTDPRQEVVEKVLAQVQTATSTLSAVKSKLTKVAEEAEDKDAKIQIKDLAPALKEAERLGEAGDELLKLKVDAESLKDDITDEQRAKLNEQFAGQLQANLEQLYKTQEELDRVVARVEQRASPEAVERLHEALDQSREKFVILTRRR